MEKTDQEQVAPEQQLTGAKKILSKLKQLVRPTGNVHEQRLRRKMKLTSLITRRLTLIKTAMFVIGYLWMVLLPVPQLGRGTFVDENALQPGQVNTQWNWGDVHAADLYLGQLEQMRDVNYTSERRAEWFKEQFSKLGISASTQNYHFQTSAANMTGTNAYAVISSPRNPGAEAMVISASWLSIIDEGAGTVNIRGVSMILALAGFLKRYSYWGKDIVLVISDGYLDGMQAWLSAYHTPSQSGLTADRLEIPSGVIWTALNIDYPGHSFSHLGVFFEGLNGRLPNQDLFNSLNRIARYTAGVPVVLYDHLDPREDSAADVSFSRVPSFLYNIQFVKSYLYQARNVLRHFGYQYNGRGSGVHGLFHQFRIDAITLFAVPATGPHGFHALGRTIESTLRTMNNLLERLHASFFFYILKEPTWFLQIGLYLPSAILISAAMMFHGLSIWVDAGWMKDDRSKSNEKSLSKETPAPEPEWKRRQRPVLDVLSIMAATHVVGLILFGIISSRLFISNYKNLGQPLFSILTTAPVMIIMPLASQQMFRKDVARRATILKAFNLCFASTVISIITVLNFSLAALLAILLGVPLVMSSSSLQTELPIRMIKYTAYAFIGLGWLLFAQTQMAQAIWDWQILSVWFAPFVCIVYAPLVLQAGISCLI
ncbi:hypothetical protein D9613_002688 [Agrocybe pediades]|uniref:Gaa1-domain-containing protein n=1 Tax=Agrocybe pediades TaxID=84607 RepID=A0A8H4QNY5_9AGAR|nr:hypothetical protein D9613_002688 [Agrocybe pediades]